MTDIDRIKNYPRLVLIHDQALAEAKNYERFWDGFYKYCHQVFGKFTGKAVLDDGQVIEVKDVMAFAEYAVNRW